MLVAFFSFVKILIFSHHQPICKIAQEGRAKACHRVDTERGKKGLRDDAAPANAIAPVGH